MARSSTPAVAFAVFFGVSIAIELTLRPLTVTIVAVACDRWFQRTTDACELAQSRFQQRPSLR